MRTKIFIGLIVLIVICLWMMRYSITPVMNGAYKLNRFTGSMTFCSSFSEYEIEQKSLNPYMNLPKEK